MMDMAAFGWFVLLPALWAVALWGLFAIWREGL